MVGIAIETIDILTDAGVVGVDQSQIFISRQVCNRALGKRDAMNSIFPGDMAFFEQSINIVRPPMLAGYPFTENQIFSGQAVVIGSGLFQNVFDLYCPFGREFLIGIQNQYPVAWWL